MFPVQTADDWDEGEHTNTTVSADALELSGNLQSGAYQSTGFDAGDTYTWGEITVDSDLNGGDVAITVETSDDGFDTVTERHLYHLDGGTESISLTDLGDSRHIRFNYSLIRGDDTPRILGTNITIGESPTFIIRDECLSAEERLFSMSDRVNAHAAEPGYYDHEVCAAGIDRSDYRTVCTDVESEVLSFYEADEPFSHLSTDSDQFDQKLCTGELSIGIRDECPDTTKSIVSIYELPDSHIAEPGYYGNHLCGAIFEDVELLMQFHHGDDDTAHINETAVEPGTYERDGGWRSGFISAEDASMVAGIVAGEYTRINAFRYDEDGDDHVLRMAQDRNVDVSYFVPFTEGDHQDLEGRRSMIRAGEFLEHVNPNFGLRLVERMVIQLTLQFTSIDIVSDMTLSSGAHQLVIENIGTTEDGDPRVRINATAQ